MQIVPLEILKDNLRKLDKEELVDMLADIMQIPLAVVTANCTLNTQKLNNVINQECAKIEQSLHETIKKTKIT